MKINTATRALLTLAIAIVQAFRISGRLPPPRLGTFYEVIDEFVAPWELDRIGELGESLRKMKNSFSDSVIGEGKLAALI